MFVTLPTPTTFVSTTTMASMSNKFLVALLAVFVLAAPFAAAQTSECQVPNCISCASDNQYMCVACTSGYYLNAGQCTPPTYCGVTNCVACMSGDPNRCASCAEGYVATAAGMCADDVGNGAAAPVAAMWTAAAAVVAAFAHAL